MNRPNSNDGGNEDSTSCKRRRWNGGDGEPPSRRHGDGDDGGGGGGRDLAEKTGMGHRRDDSGWCYGYPPSDSEDDGGCSVKNRLDRSSSLIGGGVGAVVGGARREEERRFGARSFCHSAAEDGRGTNDNLRDGEGKKAVASSMSNALPTPGGWTFPSKEKGEDSTFPHTSSNANKTPHRPPSTDVSRSSGFTLSSAPLPRRRANDRLVDNNPYAKKTSTTTDTPSSSVAPSSAATRTSRKTRKKTTSRHVTVAISENLARETCVASIDAHRPMHLQIVKQGNGQTYSETLALLRMMNPDEVLMNEGRRNSRLATKVVEMFGSRERDDIIVGGATAKKKKKKKKDSFGIRRKDVFGNHQHSRFASNRGGGGEGNDEDDVEEDPPGGGSGACETTTVVKFVPRSYFDQTKGSELLRKLAREGTYDASIVEEYILLSSSHAVLQYSQLCLGASLTRGSLTLDVNVGGNQRMSIDRSTMTNLELLVNAKTGKVANSLAGTLDCTKTSVGGRLLRTNLMAPPTRLDTINARLDLVDSLLEDEEFFYVVMEHLEDLPDVDRMLSYVALAPRGMRGGGGNNGALFGNVERQSVTARMASKGISALVCIKSTLSVIPSFAHVLEVQLRELDGRETATVPSSSAAPRRNKDVENGRRRAGSDRRDDDESTTIVESETSRNEDDSKDDSNPRDIDNAATARESGLHMGLGRNDAAGISINKRSRHQLLRAILIAMKQPALSRVLSAVTDIFTESTTYSKNSHAMRHQECFALRPNTDGMMDVLRKAFLANVDDIYRLADEYAETYDITVQVRETTSRGYYLSISADLGLDLPQIFIQPVKNGRFIHCTTEEVYSLNSRAQENVQDLLLMTHGRIQEVLAIARENYDCIASLSDAVALLDMCHCFADNVASSRLSWCRPVLSDHDRSPSQEDAFVGGGGAIAIRNGRYAIDVSSAGASSSPTGEDFVPNDAYSSALQNFTVITGINGSGKSTYLKMIALIVILAHCGSYVPADEALLPIRDQICTRIGTSDDQEHNISTFLLEMKETAYICNSTTDRSLFLLDELGRATSNEDGVAIAWAVSEYLLTTRAMTYFVTHYPQLAKLAEVYPNVQNQHLGSQIPSSSSNGDARTINYTHKIMPGPCTSAGDYGVEMAATCGWPDDAVKNARRIREEVKQKMPGEDLCYNDNSNENFAANRRNAHNILCDIAKHIAAMKEGEGRLSKDAKRNYLQELRERFVPANDESLVRTIRNLLLNVDDATPMIALTRPKPTIDVRNVKSSTDRNHKMAADEEAMSNESARDPVVDESSTKEPKEGNDAATTTNQWTCDFSSSSDSSSVSRMEAELPKDYVSNLDFTNNTISFGDLLQPTIHRDGPFKCIEESKGVVEKELTSQNQDDTVGMQSCAPPPTSMLEKSISMASSNSSSSSDDNSVSSSSSNSSSDATSSSSSSSESSSTSSSSSTG